MARDSLKGQVAIVTGASSGVGGQPAVRLAGEGARLCVTARRRDALEQLHALIAARGGECLVGLAGLVLYAGGATVRGAWRRFGRR